MEESEMVSQVLPGLKYMDERMRALEATAVGVIGDVHLPSRRMRGMMEGVKRFDGFFHRVQWQQVQNEKRGKATWKDAASELKPKSSGNTWVLPKLNENLSKRQVAPQKSHFWDHALHLPRGVLHKL